MVESTEADSSSSHAQARAGGAVLSLLASPLCAPILRAHLDGPLRLPDLRERIGAAAQTTLRGQVGNLRAVGALERNVRTGMPYTVENELTDLGRGIVGVADVLEAWLSRAPQGSIPLGGELAKGAIRALVAGWDAALLSALAAGPLSLTELDGAIVDISYPSLERRISAMRVAQQVEAVSDDAGATKPYSVTEWARRSMAPLMAASRCEREHRTRGFAPLEREDIETALLLAMPLVELQRDDSGSCLLVIGDENGGNEEDWLCVGVEIERGKVVACFPGDGLEHAVSVAGDVDSWPCAIGHGCCEGLEVRGDDLELGDALLTAMRSALL